MQCRLGIVPQGRQEKKKASLIGGCLVLVSSTISNVASCESYLQSGKQLPSFVLHLSVGRKS